MAEAGGAKAAAIVVLKPTRASDILWRAAAPCDERAHFGAEVVGVEGSRTRLREAEACEDGVYHCVR